MDAQQCERFLQSMTCMQHENFLSLYRETLVSGMIRILESYTIKLQQMTELSCVKMQLLSGYKLK
jgi:hypothetical protein